VIRGRGVRAALARWREGDSVASGIRVGTPAVTTQGMTEGDMKEVAALIGRAVRDADGTAAADIRAAVTGLVSRHPAYSRG